MQRPLLVTGIKAAPLWREEWGRLASPFKSQCYEQVAAAVPGSGHPHRLAQPEMVLGLPTPDANICRLRIRTSRSPGACSTALCRGGRQRSGRWDSNGSRRQRLRVDGSRGLAGDRNVSKDLSPSPFQGTMREVLYT